MSAGGQEGVAASWDALVERGPLTDAAAFARHCEGLAGLPTGKPREFAQGLAPFLWDVAETAVLAGPRAALARAEAVAAAFAKLRALALKSSTVSFQPPLLALCHLNTLGCIAAKDDSKRESFEVKLFQTAVKSARFLREDDRRVLGFAALALGKVDLVPRLMGGGKLPVRHLADKTFGLDALGFARHLAVGIRSGADAAAMYPAWLDFLRHFPLKLAAETLGYFDLLFAARAIAVHFEQRSYATVGPALHAFVTDAPSPDGSRAYDRPPSRVSEEIDLKTVRRAWKKSLSTLKKRGEPLLQALQKDVAGLAEGARASRLASLSTRLAWWPVGLGVDAVRELVTRADAELGAWLESSGDTIERGDSVGMVRVLAYLHASQCLGGVPPRAHELERSWVTQLVELKKDLQPSHRRELAFAAIAVGDPEAAARALGGRKLPKTLKPGQTFEKDIEGFIRYIAVAQASRAAAADVLPAFITFLAVAPAQIEERTLSTLEVSYAARAVLVNLQGDPLAELTSSLGAMLAG